MALFLSTTINKVDTKGRVSVPAAFRASLVGQHFHGIAAIPSFKYPAIQCGGMDWMEQLSSGVNAFDFFSDEHDTLTAALFSQTEQLSFDGEGRVILPASLVQHANINKEAAFVGRGPTFEIWEPIAFEKHQIDATQKAAEQRLTLRPPPPPGINEGKG